VAGPLGTGESCASPLSPASSAAEAAVATGRAFERSSGVDVGGGTGAAPRPSCHSSTGAAAERESESFRWHSRTSSRTFPTDATGSFRGACAFRSSPKSGSATEALFSARSAASSAPPAHADGASAARESSSSAATSSLCKKASTPSSPPSVTCASASSAATHCPSTSLFLIKDAAGVAAPSATSARSSPSSLAAAWHASSSACSASARTAADAAADAADAAGGA